MENGISPGSHRIAAHQLEKEKTFWLNRLSGPLVKSFFPYDIGSRETVSSGGDRAVLPFTWTGTLFNGLAAQSNHSPYKIHVILLAAITLLLDKYTGNGDIIVITPVYKPDSQGNYVNLVLPVRTAPTGQNTFKELLKQVSAFIAAASAHQNYPMEMLLEQLGMPLIQGVPSLWDTAVVLENIHDPEHLRSIHPGVSFSFRVTADSLQGRVEYPTLRYERTIIERIVLHLERLLDQAVQNLDRPLSQLEIVSAEEKKQLLFEFSPQEPLRLLALSQAAPLPGQGVYVVDRYDRLQPPGLEGEVCTAAAGFAGDTEAPFLPGQRLLKTGDLGRWLPDGGFEFSGRQAHRFIHQGCKIQPEKLERLLLKLAPLDDVVVAGLKDEQGQDCLRAYFVPAGDVPPPQLKERLSGKLPAYLMPGSFARLERIPLTPGGKTDRDPHLLEELAMAAKNRFTGPVDPTEEKLRTIWSEVLEREVETLHPDLDFAQLGGQSLKAIMMSARIHKAFNVSIPIPTIFQLATLRGMARYVREAVKTEFCSIPSAEKRDYYELSPGQKRLYLLQQLDPESTGYNVPQLVVLEGPLQRERLEGAFTRIIQRHESFRTSFRVAEDRPVQKIHRRVEFTPQYRELNREANPGQGNRHPAVEADFVRPYDLSQAPLLRVRLVKINHSRHILMIDRHHIISDATSRAIFLNHMIRLYEGEELLLLRLRYTDYSQWHNSDTQRQEIKAQEDFWLKQFREEGEIPILNLPLDYPRPVVQRFAGNSLGFWLGEEETRELHQVASREGATLFMVLLAVYIIFLSKLCSQEDIIVGTPVVGRRHEDLQDIIGIFVNTLALRHFPLSEKSLKEFLSAVKTRSLSAFENQVYPFEELVEHLAINRDISRNPLFDTVFMLQEIGAGGKEPAELQVLPYENPSTTAKFDLLLSGTEENHRLHFVFEYGTALFKESTIQRFAGLFKNTIARVLENRNIKIAEIEIISGQEKAQLLRDFYPAPVFYPREKTLQQLFAEQVAKTPDHTALVGQISNPESQIPNREVPLGTISDALGINHLSYRELNREASQLAEILGEKGVRTDTVVGILVERSIEMIVGILAILNAGGAYLPLDPKAPPERSKYLLADSKAKILLTANHLVPGLASAPEVLIELPSVHDSNSPLSPLPPSPPSGASSLAYIIYTSGSTGKPKGVAVSHANLSPLLHWGYSRLALNPLDRAVQNLSYYFDWSVWEIFIILTSGASLYMVPAEILLSARHYVELMNRHQVTVLHITPTQFQTLVHWGQRLSALKYLCLGAEKLSLNLVKRSYELVSKTCRVFNMYGPTEAAIISAVLEIQPAKLGDYNNVAGIPIGKTVANTFLAVLDRHLSPCPLLVAGELYIAGDGLARGYLNNPELTFEKFCPQRPGTFLKKGSRTSKHFFLHYSPRTTHHSPLYQTGDLARWLEDGNLEFLGRIDQQVKIRGFRIEPGEIETHLAKAGHIHEAVVAVRERQGEKYLCAYVVSEEAGELDLAELKKTLSQTLPAYMIPSYFVQIEKIPLTPNGKVDRNALPEPGLHAGTHDVAPRDKLETQLAEIWSGVLGVKKEIIGIDANFFELGGHSLKATLLTARIHKELEVKIPLVELFKTPTIREMAAFIQGLAEEKFISVEAVEAKEYEALSSAQKRLYLLQQLQPDSTGYNIPLVVALVGELDRQKLEKTFRKLIQRHESLRTSFRLVKEIPVQRIHREAALEIEIYLAGDEAGTHHFSFIIQRFIRPFDLSKAPLVRVGLIKQQDKTHLLMIDIHHIITDGASMGILVNEFMRLYAREDLPRTRLRYRDFSKWQNRLFASAKIKSRQEYWMRQFPGDIPLLDLPTDYPRPLEQSVEGDVIDFEIHSEQTGPLKEWIIAAGITPFIFLLALYTIFLSKICRQEDIVIGTPIAGRGHAGLEQIVGMFVNTLALRNHPAGEKTAGEFLKEVKANAIRAFDNQEYQFEELVEQVEVKRDVGRNPLFDVMLSFHNENDPQEIREVEIPGLKLKSYPYRSRVSRFDLVLVGEERDDGLAVTFSYCVKLFKRETVQRFVNCFKRTLAQVVENPGVKISEIEVIPVEEKNKLLYRFNDTAAPYPGDKTLHDLFAEQVTKNPDHTALVGQIPAVPFGPNSYASGIRHLSYRELEQRAAQVAETLREKGVRSDTIVGIMAQRSAEMIIGILGILKAGGAYLPLDPDYPEERKQYMLKDSGAKIFLTRQEIAGLSSPEAFNTGPKGTPSFGISPRQGGRLAYVIYTSGTTGKPKGALVNHGNVVGLLFNDKTPFDFSETDVWTLFHSSCFDFSVWEMYGALLYGGKLIVISQMTARDPQRFLEVLEKEKVTILNQTPQAFYHLAPLEIQAPGKTLGLRFVIFGGDVLKPAQLKSWREKYPETTLVNMFGITETTVHVTYKEVEPGDIAADISNIGRPLATLTVYLVDRNRKLVPMGTAGEICVGGAGLCRGYLNRPELTREKFVDNPYRKGKSLYRSGDAGKFLENGDIQYLGRIDQQVKIRGFRIEPGEIETHLANAGFIHEAVVAVRERQGEKYLCAYVVSKEAGALNMAELKKNLSQTLPAYMIPSYFVQIEKIPLTPNGKVDRNALPEPGPEAGEHDIAPRDKLEKQLAEIWSGVLGVKKEIIGIDANFFELGGHSLKAALLVNRVHKELDISIPLSKIFTAPTIRELARSMKEAVKDKYTAIAPVEKKEYYTLSSAQKRVYILYKLDERSRSYNIPLVLTLEGDLDQEKLADTFRGLIRRHESLRTSFIMVKDEPVQKVLEPDRVGFDIEGDEVEPESRELKAKSCITDFIRSFDLAKAPLLRVGLRETGKNEFLLLVDMHHIISDGTSYGILIEDFIALYSGEGLAPLRLQYKDYSHWRNSDGQRKRIKEQEAYWLEEYKGKIPRVNVPTDYPRPEVQGFTGSVVRFQLEREGTEQLRKIAGQEEATLFMVLVSIYSIFLAKISNQEDIIIGTSVSGRGHEDLERIMGMFVNTLALRNHTGADKSFRDLLREVKRKTLRAFENQDWPFEELVGKVAGMKDLSRNPVFDVRFTFNNLEITERVLPGLKARPGASGALDHTSKFDLTLAGREVADKLDFSFEYCVKLFTENKINRYVEYIKAIAALVIKNPDILLRDIKIFHEFKTIKAKTDEIDLEF